MKRIVQIGAVVIALTMLAGYVVYSQRGHNANMVAPGSKTRTYVVEVAPPATTNAKVPRKVIDYGSMSAREAMIAFGSKSAPVFVPELTPVAAQALSSTAATKTNLHIKP